MRIVHLIDYFQSEFTYQEVCLAQEQRKLGHDVHVITSDRYSPMLFGKQVSTAWQKRIQGVGYFSEAGIPVHRMPIKFEYATRPWLSGFLAKIVELQPQVIHMHNTVNFTAFRLALAIAQGKFPFAPTVLYDEHIYAEVSQHYLRRLYPLVRRMIAPSIQNSATAIIAVSEATKRFMIKNFGFRENNISVIKLGVDVNVFSPNQQARTQTRARLGLQDHHIVCISTGRFEPRKQLDLLLYALAKLKAKHPQAKLLLVGHSGQEYTAVLESLIETLNLAEQVIWHPSVPPAELANFFNAADMAIWPAGHSISFLEAMACALPLIVADTDKTREEVSFGNGLTFAPGAAEDLAAQIDRLLSDQKLRSAYGDNSRIAATTYYSWQVINEQFMKFYTTEPTYV